MILKDIFLKTLIGMREKGAITQKDVKSINNMLCRAIERPNKDNKKENKYKDGNKIETNFKGVTDE